MTRGEAAAAMVALLRDENAALERHDFAAAGALLDRKQAAARWFAETKEGADVPPDAARELAALADANRRLLERAIGVQRQVIATVARAANGGSAVAGGRYARTGAPVRPGAGQALISRA